MKNKKTPYFKNISDLQVGDYVECLALHGNSKGENFTIGNKYLVIGVDEYRYTIFNNLKKRKSFYKFKSYFMALY